MRPAEDAVADRHDRPRRRRGRRADRAARARPSDERMNRVDAVWAVGRYTIGTLVRLRRAAAQLRRRARAARAAASCSRSTTSTGSTRPSSACFSPRPIYFLAKVEAHRVPGLGQLIRSFGTISVRRGESDREAVRRMREVVRDGHALGLFAEGTRQRSGVPGRVQPGAAMAALQEDVPGRPGRDPRLVRVEGRQLPPDLGRVGRAAPLRRAAEGGEGLPRGLGRDRAAHPRPPRLARRDARARPAAPGDSAAMSETAPEIIGTVAIVGFPNVGKSTLINRLTETRQAVVHETPGRDARPQGAARRLERQALPPRSTRAASTTSPPIPSAPRSRGRRAPRSRRPTSSSSSSTPGTGSRPATRSSRPRCGPRRSPCSCSRTRSTTRARDLDAVEFHKLGLGDPFPLSALHGHGTGDLLDEIVERLPGEGRAQVGDEAIRVAILGRPNVGKSSLLNALVGRERVIVSDVPGTTRDAIDTILRRDDRTSTAWSTPPACGGSGSSGRGSSTTRSCARSRRPSGPTSRSS